MDEEIFKKLEFEKQGVKNRWRIADLRFADEVALTKSSVKDMEVQLNSLNKESKKIGLKIHEGKTKFMTNFQTNKSIEIR